jgi:putative transposase
MFQGEYLAAYAGETVSVRFDPRDITTILLYCYEDGREVFLTRAFAHSLETENLSYEEAKAASKRLRAAGKTLSNEAILQEAIERDALTQKKSRKQRQKAEQALAKPQPKPLKFESTEAEPIQKEPEVDVALDTAAFEAIDFDELRGGW